MSNEDKDKSWWQELRPAIYGFVGLFLIIVSIMLPSTIPSLLSGAEGVVIGYTSSLASILTGSWLFWKFRKSE